MDVNSTADTQRGRPLQSGERAMSVVRLFDSGAVHMVRYGLSNSDENGVEISRSVPGHLEAVHSAPLEEGFQDSLENGMRSEQLSRHGMVDAPLPHLDAILSAPTTSMFSPASRVTYSDRFIPSRLASSLTNYSLIDRGHAPGIPVPSFSNESREDSAAAYSALLRSEIFGADASLMSPQTPDRAGTFPPRDPSASPASPVRNLFRYKNDSRGTAGMNGGIGGLDSPFSLSPVGHDGALTGVPSTPRQLPRKVARSPFKVLDAPALADDFYLNLVDWSPHNVLAVGLGTCVYLWSACTSKVTKLCDLGPDDTVCAVGWTQRGTYLSVGTNKGEVQIWDAARCRKVRSLGGHRMRVGALAWSGHILSSGGRDRIVLQHDVRMEQDFVSQLAGHRSEVCGLKWSPDDRELASGGNDNQLLVWNKFSTQPLLRFQSHQAAVKAIAWSPHQHGLLASGGGTADRCIRFWNTATGTGLSCVDTGSQVCNLAWSKNVNELVSTHGYSQNQIIIWRYPTMSKLATLTGHTMRVLFLSISPDGQTIVTGAGDETLRFWSAFPASKAPSSVREAGVWSMGRTQIR